MPKNRDSERERWTSVCATGSFHASVIGVRRFRLYIVISAERLRFPKVSCRCACPKMLNLRVRASRRSANAPNLSIQLVRNAAVRQDAKPIQWIRLYAHRGTIWDIVTLTIPKCRLIKKRRIIGWTLTSISAALNTQFCTCFMQDFSPRLCTISVISAVTSRSKTCLLRVWF